MTPTPTTDSAVSPVRELSDERLREMLAGLEGTTPGPWECVGDSITDWSREWEASMSMEFVPNGTGEEGMNERHVQDAAHIARCDPDTMRAILTELLASRTPNTETVVKALEWGAGDEAVTPFGTYRVVRTDDGYALTFEHDELVHVGFNAVEPFQSPRNEAMSRAQPHFDQRIRSALASPPSPAEVTFQDRVAEAHIALFHDDPTDIAERRDRFGEEANEAQQALGQTREGAHQLVDYTYDRPAGEPEKEIGAAALTLASLCVVGGWDMMECAEADLAALRTPEKIAKVRAKRATRHGRGPLPGLDALQLGKKG